MQTTVRVLMLEDSAEDAEMIQGELGRSGGGFTYRRVETEADFVKALDEFRPDLVLSNYQLTETDGLAALAHARRKHPALPFIFVSWEIHDNSVVEVISQGATDYVFKDHLKRLPLSVFRALREAEETRQLHSSQQKIIEQERLGALGQMASGIAHDFSNALTPVLGFSEILLNHPENLQDRKKLIDYLTMINTAARDAMSIVARLREFYRGRKKADPFLPVNLKQITEQVVLLTRPRWKDQALAKGAVIKVETELDPASRILGDDAAMREVLTNLIFNAVDAMPRGGAILIRSWVDESQVYLETSDTGKGMSEEVRRRCFEPFFSTKGRSGTGMGLAMVYGVIRRHEGSIDVRSEPGQGTAFLIRLPRLTPSQEKAPAAVLPAAGRPVDRKLHVLVVDDEPLVRQVVQEYLLADGCTVETASDGNEGYEKFTHGRYDLVFTDWAMPGMNGDQMTAKIKQAQPGMPVIMLTGFGDLMKPKSGFTPSPDLVLSKPATLATIRDAIRKVVGA